LHFGKTEVFLQKGLDSPNQLDPAQQIRFYAQIREAVEWVERSPSGQISWPALSSPQDGWSAAIPIASSCENGDMSGSVSNDDGESEEPLY
jgi:hypothetical protein